jgi:hypothetical protein
LPWTFANQREKVREEGNTRPLGISTRESNGQVETSHELTGSGNVQAGAKVSAHQRSSWSVGGHEILTGDGHEADR